MSPHVAVLKITVDKGTTCFVWVHLSFVLCYNFSVINTNSPVESGVVVSPLLFC